MALYVPICPTKPQVPIPDSKAEFSIPKNKIATGPIIAEAKVGGIQIFQFLYILGTYNILVPNPCANTPLKPLSL